jgi:DtxR family Mn-dependent transcriptional regulator
MASTPSTPLTRGAQEYLESIYWLYEAGIERTPTNLSRALQVSPPSVSEMLRRLEDANPPLVTRSPDKRVSLTERGEQIARHVVSRHRLIEAFLVKVMGLPWDDVHEEAETFEMGVTPQLEARMLELIGDVKTCPHGHPIGDYPREPGIPLTAVPTGSVVRVLRFENEDHKLLQTFRSQGVEPRGRYRVTAHADQITTLAAAAGDRGESVLPTYMARTISVAVERSGDGEPGEQDPRSLATAYLLGESHWSR